MKTYVAYDKKGEVVVHGTCQHCDIGMTFANLVPLAAMVVETTTEDLHFFWVRNKELVRRPFMDTAVSGGSVTGVPQGAEVFLDDELIGTCESGVLELEREGQEDAYHLKLVKFPYIDCEMWI